MGQADESKAATARAERAYIARSRDRFRMLCLGFIFCFLLIAGRLVTLGFPGPGDSDPGIYDISSTIHRPDILDRKGRLIATDIKGATLYADPKKVIDPDELVEQVATVLPDIDKAAIRRKIEKGGRFVLIHRELTPVQQAEVFELGLPGLGFIQENRRVYPTGDTVSPVVGFVDVDNQGLAGIEKFIDQNPQLSMSNPDTPDGGEAVRISIDLGVQHVLHEELANAMTLYEAKAATGVVLDVHSGEVLGMASLPDYDPNHRDQALDPNRHDRMTAGVYELGSVFKVMTVAGCLDDGTATLNSRYDTTGPLRIGGFAINDFEPMNRLQTVREIFIHSSNIGAAKMAVQLGIPRHKAFLKKMGLLGPIVTELGPTADPLFPKHWETINTMTIAFGHGISVTPLQFAAAAIPVVNGGIAITPTFLPRSRAEGMASGHRVLKQSTSADMVELMRDNVLEGTGRQAEAPGYRVGGKTGTANKVINGHYSNSAVRNSFLATFPADDPQYIVFVMLDEPKKVAATHFLRTAGANAAPTVGHIIARIAPILDVQPKLNADMAPFKTPPHFEDDATMASND